HLGYLYPGKGIETLLRAFALLAAERGRAKLVVVGGALEGHEAYPAAVHRLATELGIQKGVRWVGAYAWDGSRGSAPLRAADVFVMPIEIGVQLNNSSVGAAAAHGLPLVATRGELVERAFRDGENVLLCAPRDPHAMAAAIRTVMDDEPLRRRLRSGARELADEWFSWRRAVDRTLATFSA
ncbi:MAG: glycosyltransferase, partial [Thermoleophilia bacterium]|nr:glycosyltransferase [Thermoleophilia bacterium]